MISLLAMICTAGLPSRSMSWTSALLRHEWLQQAWRGHMAENWASGGLSWRNLMRPTFGHDQIHFCNNMKKIFHFVQGRLSSFSQWTEHWCYHIFRNRGEVTFTKQTDYVNFLKYIFRKLKATIFKNSLSIDLLVCCYFGITFVFRWWISVIILHISLKSNQNTK